MVIIMDNKTKYLIYKTKYLYLKKINQKGGMIKDVYEYLKDYNNKIESHYLDILQEYADSLVISNPNITLEEFISSVNIIYGIKLPPPRLISHVKPIDDNMDIITVYTTGIAYIENDNKREYIKALIDNIVETCERENKRVHFIHYDIFNDLKKRYYKDEIFVNGYLTPQMIRDEIENKPNVLLVDIAHVIHYYKSPIDNKPLMKYYAYGEIVPPQFDEFDVSLNINCFYPGFIGDMETINYIRFFKFFQFINNNIVTFIEKGIEKNIKIREIYKGSRTTIIDFTNSIIDITGLIANVYSSEELNQRFWE